jgi:hypothetical protein
VFPFLPDKEESDDGASLKRILILVMIDQKLSFINGFFRKTADQQKIDKAIYDAYNFISILSPSYQKEDFSDAKESQSRFRGGISLGPDHPACSGSFPCPIPR